jgi:hypothetical protein
MPGERGSLIERAHDVAESRLYAAAHFPSDVLAGARIGGMVGAYVLATAPSHAGGTVSSDVGTVTATAAQ